MKKLLLIIMTLQLSVAEAERELNLYSGEVVVSSQGEDDRNAAIPEALIQVLHKLSGQREIPLSSALDKALVNARNLLRSYRYSSVDRTGPNGDVTTELRLVAQFMQPEVDRVVQQVSLPRWQQERPVVEIWVVIDDGSRRVLKPIEYNYAWESMEDIAANRGLPLSWPELDEEQAQLIDMRLLWGGFTDYLIKRGAPEDGVAIIAALRNGPTWNLRWNLVSGEHSWSWRTSDVELMFALAEGVHQMTDRFASVRSIAVSDQGSWAIDLTVAELRGADDYVACLDYLQNLSIVTAVEILGADPGRVYFRIELNASTEYLHGALRRGSVLLPADTGNEYEYVFFH